MHRALAGPVGCADGGGAFSEDRIAELVRPIAVQVQFVVHATQRCIGGECPQ